jgi:predicted HAD superfamily phosphohydrolase YqeG
MGKESRHRRPSREHHLRATYERLTSLDETLGRVQELSARTVILDIEPLVAYWDSSQEVLDQGVASVVAEVAAIPGVQVVCLATNSLRRPSQVPTVEGVRIVWLAGAAKPLRTAPYREFPRPGVVIGDQVTTDGLLASRLGYVFLQYRPPLDRIPPGPWLMDRLGRLIRPLAFTRRN